MATIAELLEARGEIAQLEALKKRSMTEDDLVPILHNRRVAVQDIEQELREDYKEKFPKWLNTEDLETTTEGRGSSESLHSGEDHRQSGL